MQQALPVLQHIPYRLVLVDCEIPGMTGVEFARIINESDKGQGIYLVALTDSRAGSFAADLADCGAFLAERSTWRNDLSEYLTDIEGRENLQYHLQSEALRENDRMPFRRRHHLRSGRSGIVSPAVNVHID